ncbi:hypothetical protein [Photobacterium rosenbergii]|uniref:Porin n=1 Tax=Photobacterium rosenbergii TaxID=294936 RepID=A0ABU3ZEX2_9GAMM|nr:hypothetical protein [Photobacterium rosenbergii]MDV5168578.1 hypothetical protein [Photobacterium rosenbergii]
MINKKIPIFIVASSLVSVSVFADTNEQDINPADVTRAYTQLNMGVSNQGDVRLLGSLSYNHKGGTASMASLEGVMDEDGSYKSSRLQYFHVWNRDSAFMPRIAASLDVIDNEMFTTAALGTAAIFPTSIDGFNVFGRVAALAGKYDDDFASHYGGTGTSTDIAGGMGAIYFVYTADSGSFIAYYPEYSSLSGDIDVETTLHTITAGVPLSESKDKWIQFKFEDSTTDITASRMNEQLDNRILWTQFKLFF